MRSQSRLVSCLAAIPLVVGARVSVAVGVAYETVVMSGDAAPGLGEGVVFGSFSIAPVISDDGRVATLAFLQGPGINATNDFSAWVFNEGVRALVAREGDDAVGTEPGVVFGNPTRLILGEGGSIGFEAGLSGSGIDGTNDTGFWSADTGAIQLVARLGDPAPGTGQGVVFSALENRYFNSAGDTAFFSFVQGPGVGSANSRGVWLVEEDELMLLARNGNAAPGTGAVFHSIGLSALNDAGEVALLGRLSGPGVTSSNRNGIWVGTPDTLNLMVRSGENAPGTQAGVVFSSFMHVRLNGSGQIAFSGMLSGPSVVATNNIGLWSNPRGEFEQVARSGDHAVGTANGVVFSGFGTPVLSNEGHTAFTGFLSGVGVDSTNSTGYWIERDGLIELVARAGDPAPNTEPGVVFHDFNSTPVINSNGQMAFLGRFLGPSIDGTNETGLYLTDTLGQPLLVAREGDLFDVNPDPVVEDLRRVVTLGPVTNSGEGTGGEDGRGTSFNDAGQLAYYLRFSDNSSGIFIASLLDSIPGDITGDGFVGVADLDILLANWGDEVGTRAIPSGDLSGDGVVGQDDLTILLGFWGNGALPIPNVPEPGSLALMLGAWGILGRRRNPRQTFTTTVRSRCRRRIGLGG